MPPAKSPYGTNDEASNTTVMPNTGTGVNACSAPANLCAMSISTTLAQWAEMIKLEHTVFALPFALSGLILASAALPQWTVVFWTVLAFAGARCAAMTLNRLIDAELDARNPRTSMRAIPTGKITPAQAYVFSFVSFAVMVGAASQLPPICLWLSPIAIAWLSFYSFTKRFTWACHFVLGGALGGAALGGWVAAGGSLAAAAPWWLAVAVSTWVAGFDLIYSCQDVFIDKAERLFSIPSCFSIKSALVVSSLLHAVTVSALLLLGVQLALGFIYFAGVALVTVMLIWEHSLVKADDLSRVNAAFFNINGCVSIAMFLAIFLDKIFASVPAL